MKHLLTLLVLLLRMCLTAVAQEESTEPAHEHRTAFHPYQEIMLGHGFMPLAPSRLRYVPFGADRITGTGAISGTYRLHFTRLLSLGITAAYDHSTYQWIGQPVIENYGPGISTEYFAAALNKTQRTTFTVASELTFTYLRSHNDLVRLYSGLGLGYAIGSEKNNYVDRPGKSNIPVVSTSYTSNICLIGIRAGRALGGYAELGRGYKGTLCYGMYYSF